MLTSGQKLAGLGSWIWDCLLHRLSLSDQTYRVLGLGEADFDGTLEGFLQHVNPDDHSSLREAVDRLTAGARDCSYRYRLRGIDGSERIIVGDAESHHAADGTLLRLVGTVTDVTERERERRAIRESEERFRSLLALSSDWYWEQDADLRFTRFPGGREWHWENGFAIVGKRRWELGGVTVVGTWEDHQRTLRAREPFRDFEYRLPGERYISVTGEPFYGTRGEFCGYRGTACDITDRKRAEERLRQGHAMLRMAMRVGRIGAWRIELPQRSISWAEGGRVIHTLEGRPAQSLEEILRCVAPLCRATLQAAVDACAAQGRRFDIEVQLLPGTLPAAWMRLVGEADCSAGDCAGRLHGTVEDVTDRKFAAERVRGLGSRRAAPQGAGAECLVTINREWCFTYVNDEGEQFLGRSREQLLGRNLWDEFPEARGSRIEQEYRRALEEQETVEFEEFYAPLRQWLLIKACPSPGGLAIYFRDITDGGSVRNALIGSEEQFRRLFENTPDGVLYTEPEGRIVRANAAACVMLERGEDELRECRRPHLIAIEDTRYDRLRDERAHRGWARGEITMLRPDGSRFEAEVSSAEYLATDGTTRAFVIFRDITDRLLAREEILQLNADLGDRVARRTAELQAANAELKAFAHSLAHDLRGPIAVIDGFSEMLERSLPAPLPARAAHYLGRIRNAGRTMDAYTEGLLLLARVSQASLQIAPVDLSALARETLTVLQERESTRDVECYVEDGLVGHGDEALLRMALQNLLGNAWKFTGRREKAQIRFEAKARRGKPLVYMVQDNGAGFDMAYADKLFGSFQRLHSNAEFPGTGIGLANVHRIVTRHGGRIWAESQIGVETRFLFTLAPG